VRNIIIAVLLGCGLLSGGSAVLAETVGAQPPLRVLIDVRSDHSDGEHDFSTLIGMAQKRGIDVLAFTEHDRYSIRFGIEPVPQVLGYSMQHPSLYLTGVQRFFDDIAALQRRFPQIVLMAGTESTPGYAWSGVPLRDLTLHDAERHIIALGVQRPEQVEALPSFDLRNIHGPYTFSMAFWFLLVCVVLVWLLRRRKRAVALLLFASYIAFLATWLGRPPVDADADFIATAKQQGLFTIWAHPGTLSGTRPGPMGVMLETPPYSSRVFIEPTADAFAAIYGDTDSNTVPGGLWDRYLSDYMMGLRAAPIWAVSSGDYHEEGQSGEYLGNFPMDVWADARTSEAVLKALRAGHAVAWRQTRNQNFRVSSLYLEDASGQRLLPGDEALVSPDVELNLALRMFPVPPAGALPDKPVRVRVIVDGQVANVAVMRLDQPLKQGLHLASGAHVLRVDIPGQWLGGMIANPFLLRVR